MITMEEEMSKMEKLLETKKEFILREKEERFLGPRKTLVDKIRNYVKHSINPGILNAEGKYDYSEFILKLSKKYDLKLNRWRVKECKVNMDGNDYEIYQMLGLFNVYLVLNRNKSEAVIKLIQPSDLKITNPTANNLIRYLKSYDLVEAL